MVAVGYMMMSPSFEACKGVHESGTLGRILSVRAEGGFVAILAPEDYRDFYMSWKTGGGGHF